MAMFPDRAKAVQFSKPYVANIILLVAPKTTEVKTNADMGKLDHRGSARQRPGHPGHQERACRHQHSAAGRRRRGDPGPVSGQATAVGGNMFYIDRFNEAKPGLFGRTSSSSPGSTTVPARGSARRK